MSFNVTQCPVCDSTFNTNSRVLAATAGRVRCGACLNVFEAIDNFLIREETDAAQNQDESVFVGNDPQEFFDPSSFLTRSDLREIQSDEPDQGDPINEKNLHQELKKSETLSEEFFTSAAGELQGRTEAPAVEGRHKGEESLIDRPETLEANINHASIDEEFKEGALDSFTTEATDAQELIEDDPADSFFERRIEPRPEPAANNENASVEIKSPSDEASAIHSLATQKNLASERVAEDEEPGMEAAHTSAQEMDEESTESIRCRALEAELSDEEALEAIPRESLAALRGISTPVELLAKKESRLLRSTLLFLSSLLLGGLLSSQYLWQRMELYSQLPQLRPLYEVACNYLNCALPQYADIDSIRSENLTVQTHPSFANGLLVNTVIRNTAAFEQPFPILILSFNSVENSVIALREFTSAEYLDPALHSIKTMPPKMPVQIGLAIMDPGPEAANYTLAFRRP